MTSKYESINQAIADRVKSCPDQPILLVPDHRLILNTYTYRQLDDSATLLAHHLNQHDLVPKREIGDADPNLVVGLYMQSSYDYVILELALIRLGYCVLLISPNNSADAIAHLLMSTGASRILFTAPYLQTLEIALKSISGNSSVKTISQPDPSIYKLPHPERIEPWEYPLTPTEEKHLPFVMIHSSGSTGFPKPIPISHHAGVVNYSQNFGLVALSTLPLYHNHGHSNFYRAILSGKPMGLFPTSVLPLTASNILKTLNNAIIPFEGLYSVPLVLKFMVEDAKSLLALQSLKLVMFGGSPLPDEVGKKLVENGVRLVGHYGTTEVGQLGTSFRDFNTDHDWDYVRISGALGDKFIVFEEQAHDLYELVVLDGWPAKVVDNAPEKTFRTKDLFSKHPAIPNAWKYCGRLDDTLNMVNGEKINPVPMELTIKGESPYIVDVVIFGTGRTQIGALIIPSELSLEKSRSELLDIIRPVICLANSRAPSHSQLAMDHLIILPVNASIPRADKGSFIRQKTYKMYETEIVHLYQTTSGSLSGGRGKKLSTRSEALAVVREIVLRSAPLKEDGIPNSQDLFDAGVDSIQSTRIRNDIQKECDLGSLVLPTNFVFEYPSINRLADRLLDLVLKQEASSDGRELIDRQMLELVERYSAKVIGFSLEMQRKHDHRKAVPASASICITGVTGALGVHLLNQLVFHKTVSRVWCLVRASNDAKAIERVVSSLEQRGLNTASSQQWGKVICLAADLRSPRLAINENRYPELCASVNHIVHVGWPVNFNLHLSSFEPSLEGVVNLMRLCLDSRCRSASFSFVSSISAVYNWSQSTPVPEAISNDPCIAQSMGYAQSKWVVENICGRVTQAIGLPTRIMRVGQLVGDSVNGIWNETEAIPLMIKAGDRLGVMPTLDESLSWLPVDQAASIIIDLLAVPSQSSALCWHVLQPHRTSWTSLLDHLEDSGLRFRRLLIPEWIQALRVSDPDPDVNPSIKLLPFWEAKYGQPFISRTQLVFMTQLTRQSSFTMSKLEGPTKDLTRKWVESWRKTGFLKRTSN